MIWSLSQFSQAIAVVITASRSNLTLMPISWMATQGMRSAPSGSVPAVQPRGDPGAERGWMRSDDARPDLDAQQPRRQAVAQLDDDAVHFADLAVLAVHQLIVQHIFNQIHVSLPPRISNGIEMIASTNVSTMTNTTTLLEIHPLR